MRTRNIRLLGLDVDCRQVQAPTDLQFRRVFFSCTADRQDNNFPLVRSGLAAAFFFDVPA